MGLTVTTDNKPVTVVRKDGVSQNGKAYTMYSLMYSFKNGEEWKNVFVDCAFKKGTDLANKTKINITNSFMIGVEKNINGKIVVMPKIFVLDYEVEGSQPAPAPNDVDMSFMNIPDEVSDMLPFN